MKQVFTMIAVVALMTACFGKTDKKNAEAEAAATEVVATEACCAEGEACCKEGEACAKDGECCAKQECAAAATEAPAETPAEAPAAE